MVSGSERFPLFTSPFSNFSSPSAINFTLSSSLPVPTAPPQNVHAEAVNSTTIQFFWNPPPQQFINGINQGYKVWINVMRAKPRGEGVVVY